MRSLLILSLLSVVEMLQFERRGQLGDSVLMTSEENCKKYSSTAQWVRTDKDRGSCMCGDNETFGPLDDETYGCFKGSGKHLG